MKISLKKRIYRFLAQNKNSWINGGELERLAMEAGYKASNASRRARELVHEGSRIERKEENGSVWYRYVPIQTLIDPVTRTATVLDPLQQKLL